MRALESQASQELAETGMRRDDQQWWVESCEVDGVDEDVQMRKIVKKKNDKRLL